ncbi:kinesin-like protein KIN-5C isoform X1 [Euphorbia lathyris]|uniref:kinesin-like protein KIN-5C isoform X1 n=1 Tax=Euphorbia lathyris TaxID=212925 RepID=UPI0033138DA4
MSKLKPQTTSLLSHESFPFFFSVSPIRERISQSQIPQKESTLNPVDPRKPLSIQSQILISIFNKYKNLNQVKQLHAPVTTSGMLISPAVANNLLYKYIRFYDLPDARLLFDRMPERDLVSWNSMISGYVQDGDFFNCLNTFRELIKFGVRPDHSTLAPVIKVCMGSMRFNLGRSVHCFAVRNGLNSDVVCGRLVYMYAQSGMVEDAKKLFDKMHIKNLETWTIMIHTYAECRNMDEVLFLYARMREEGFSPNEVVMMALTNVGAKFGAMNKASLVHDYTKETNIPNLLSITKQDEHLQYVREHCQSFQDMHDKVVKHIKWRLTAVSASYISQIEAMQNFVRLHRASSGLEESLASANAHPIEHKIQVSSEQTKEVSNYMYGFVKNLSEQSQDLQNCAIRVDKIQFKSIGSFQKAYEEHSKPVAEKLVADINHLVSNHIRRLKEMVEATLVDLRGSATGKKTILDGHVSMQAENNVKDAADYSGVKHCHTESLLQRCVSSIKSALKHWKIST